PLAGIQKHDLDGACQIKGLCGLSSHRQTHQPSLCVGTLPSGLYAAGCMPLPHGGVYAPPSLAKWMPTSQALIDPGAPENLVLAWARPSKFSADPLSPPPRA
ncbi:MAG: hypothetical protein ACREL1_07730, partial [bacterium]